MSSEKSKIYTAIRFAKTHHGTQRYGDHPYHVHLGHVEDVLREAGYSDDDELLVGAWLHDVLEDTSATYNDIKKTFGESIAELVYAVTDELGRNRKERKTRTYPKIKRNKKATILKIADRIANIRFARDTENLRMKKMYLKEYVDFYDGIYIPAVADKMWDFLNVVHDVLNGEMK